MHRLWGSSLYCTQCTRASQYLANPPPPQGVGFQRRFSGGLTSSCGNQYILRWQRNSRLWSWRDIRASPAAIAERPKLQSEAKLSLSITEDLQCPLPPTPGSHQGLTYDALSTLNDLLHLLHWLARWSSGSYAYVWHPSSRVARSFFALSKGKALLMKGLVTLSMNVVFIQHYKHTHKEL